MRRHMVPGVLAAGMVVALTGMALAKSLTIMIPAQDVAVRDHAGGDSYVVKFDLPSDLAGKRLDSVFLDFVVDLSSTSEAEADATPLIAVYPLTAAATGSWLEYETNVPSVRPVSTGEGRGVRADITEIVKGWLASPSSNHGLIIGALAGPEAATVVLNSEALDGAALRVTFFYQNRFGERVSRK